MPMPMQSLSELYATCIKLATANKITAKNTWELQLIDHMTDVLNTDEQANASSTYNFPKACGTLEASIMIYSSRVDDVHKETYKVLGGLSYGNNGRIEEEEEGEDGEVDENGRKKKKGISKRGLSTLDPAPSKNLNMKSLDTDVEIDPLFQKTTAAFDEGGAKGLLLNNLATYGWGGMLVLDSQETKLFSQDQSKERRAALESQQSQDMDMSEFYNILSQSLTKAQIREKNEILKECSMCPTLKEFYELRQRIIDNVPEESQSQPKSTKKGTKAKSNAIIANAATNVLEVADIKFSTAAVPVMDDMPFDAGGFDHDDDDNDSSASSPSTNNQAASIFAHAIQAQIDELREEQRQEEQLERKMAGQQGMWEEDKVEQNDDNLSIATASTTTLFTKASTSSSKSKSSSSENGEKVQEVYTSVLDGMELKYPINGNKHWKAKFFHQKGHYILPIYISAWVLYIHVCICSCGCMCVCMYVQLQQTRPRPRASVSPRLNSSSISPFLLLQPRGQLLL